MKPTTVLGFYICDDYGEQHLIAVAGIEACDKRWARWAAENLRAPSPKSKLLAAYPNEHPSMDRRLDWMPDYPENDDKPIDAEWDWGKA